MSNVAVKALKYKKVQEAHRQSLVYKVLNEGQSHYLKVPDVAELMDVPISTIYELTRQNRIGGIVRFGRHIRFDRDELERWLQAGGEKTDGRS